MSKSSLPSAWWTGGIPQLVQLAAPWLSTATPEEITGGIVTFTERDEVQAFLLDWLTGLMDSYDRDVLEAASIFRDQFTDAALAFVTGRTTGQVSDISRRLVRYHVALRGRGGDVAFVHGSIRDYVYLRHQQTVVVSCMFRRSPGTPAAVRRPRRTSTPRRRRPRRTCNQAHPCARSDRAYSRARNALGPPT